MAYKRSRKKSSRLKTKRVYRKRKTKRKVKQPTNLFNTLLHLFHPRKSNYHRAKILHPEALLYFVGIVAGLFALVQMFRYIPSLKDGVLGFASNITPMQVIEQTNQKRVALGMAPIKMNDRLNQAALAKAQDMFNKQYWSHNSPDGKNPWFFIKNARYDYVLAGENLARDFATTPEMMAAWMASPTHKANIINPKYEEIGIAVVDGVLDGFETTLVVQMFGTPRIYQAAIPDQGAKAPAEIPAEAKAQDNDLVAFVVETDQGLEPANDNLQKPVVLAGALIPVGMLTRPPLFTPLQITKALFLSVIMLIIITLLYDGMVIGRKKTARLVGQNLAHIIFLSTVAFLLIFFKGGVIG